MALKKKRVINNIEVEYWRIVGFSVSMTGKMAQVFVVGYVSEDSRALGRDVVSSNYMITKKNFDKYIKVTDGVHTRDLYGYLQSEVEEFKDSENI